MTSIPERTFNLTSVKIHFWETAFIINIVVKPHKITVIIFMKP